MAKLNYSEQNIILMNFTCKFSIRFFMLNQNNSKAPLMNLMNEIFREFLKKMLNIRFTNINFHFKNAPGRI